MKLTPERTPLNIVPFIDIMLVLLCIVLSISSFIAQGKIEVKLPSSSSQAEPEKRQTYAVTIHLSEEERRQLDAYMSAHEIDAYGHALRYFMWKELARFHRKTVDIPCNLNENMV